MLDGTHHPNPPPLWLGLGVCSSARPRLFSRGSVLDHHLNAGVADGFAGRDLKDAVAVEGLELFSFQTAGEAEAAAPSAGAEFAQQSGRLAFSMCGGLALGTHNKGAY